MPSEAGIADCRVSECDRKTVPRSGTRNRKCSTAVCGQSVKWDHKCVLLSRPEMLPWHDSAGWDDMVRQIGRCTAVQTPMDSDDQLERDSLFTGSNTKTQRYRHKYKQTENNDQVHHSSWHFVLAYKQNIIYHHLCSLNLIMYRPITDVHQGEVYMPKAARAFWDSRSH